MKKIVIIGVYFGEFPSNYKLWLRSCEYNSTVDFLIFTNQMIESKMKNVKYINISFENFNKLIKNKIGNEFNIEHPYKCCDYRPAYGVIFEDYIREYDFWGHCDFDMIFGDIRKFITEDMLNIYDKILPLGHLSLYRNTSKVNNRYKEEGSLVGDYEEVFRNSNENFAFDEIKGIGNIYYRNKYPFFDKIIFADISITKKRFTLILNDKNRKNYNNQVFYWENGHVCRAYEDDGIIKIDEFIYIHFKQRKYLKNLVDMDNCNSFYICDLGFIQKENRISALNDIKKYNKYPGKLYEICEEGKFKYKEIKRKIKKRILNKI